MTLLPRCARAVAAASSILAVAQLHAQTGARPDLPIKLAPSPTSAAVTAQDLMSRLYVFADDSMQGREAGTPGHVRGTEYLVRELKRIGLKPMGDNGTFYQLVPVASARFELSNAKITMADGSRLTPGVDFHPFVGVADLPFSIAASAKAPVVFGGRFGSVTAIRPEEVKGKIVVFAAPSGQGGQPGWQVFAQDDAIAAYREAAALVVASFEVTPPQIWGILSEEAMMLKKADARVPMVIVTKAAAGRLIGANIDTARVGTPGKDAEITYGPTYVDPPAPSRNVLAMVEGSDPNLKAQVLVLSAHSDHVGIAEETVEHDSLRLLDMLTRPMGVESPEREMLPNERARFRTQLDSVRKLRAPRLDSISNGADDDGSGAMGLLELAEYFQSLPQKPKRSILFLWNVAEEKGLFGSDWFTEHPTVPRDSIIANVNIDMIGRGAAEDIENGGMDYLQLLGSRRLSTEYGNWVEEVNKAPAFNFKFDYQFDAPGHPQQYYCRSDHWNFARWSIPTVFFSTGSHVDYHMVTDEPQYIDYPHYTKVVNFVGAFALDVANRPLRPVVDKARPDPRGECKQ